MLRWADNNLLDLKWEEIGEHYGRYRLHVPEAERAMARSLERYGQLSPVVVCRRQDRYELIDGFKRLGAVRGLAQIPRLSARVMDTCLYDNMKVVVTGYDGDQPIYNTRFLSFATHYGYQPWACRPHRPQTKGKVERPFAYVETNLLNGRTFTSLEHLNETAALWLAEVADLHVHRETKRRPIDLYQEEKPHLLRLPARAYDTAQVFYRTVNPEGHVAYLQNFYSVPWQRIGELLPIRITEKELIVYGPEVKEIARHELYPSGISGQKRSLAESFHQNNKIIQYFRICGITKSLRNQ